MTFNRTAHALWEDRQLDEYLDGPESEEVDCPVMVVEPKGEGYFYKEKTTGRFVSAQDAVYLMETEGYTGSELEDAKDIAKDREESKAFTAYLDAFKTENGRYPSYEEWPKKF